MGDVDESVVSITVRDGDESVVFIEGGIEESVNSITVGDVDESVVTI